MTTYYVRPGGNNTNLGTGYLESQAFATISKAASVMAAGDTVYISPGIYNEQVTITVSGSSGSPISYIGDPYCEQFIDMQKGDVIITGINQSLMYSTLPYCIYSSAARTYLNFSNLILTGAYTSALSLASIASNYINLTNIKIIDNIPSPSSDVLVGTNCIFSNCTIISSMNNDANYSITTGSTLTFNKSYVKSLTGYAISAATGSTFTHSIIYGAVLGASPNFSGCIVTATNAAVGLFGSSTRINIKGCVLDGNGLTNVSFDAIQSLYATTIKNLNIATYFSLANLSLKSNLNLREIKNCSFINCSGANYLFYIPYLTSNGVTLIQHCDFTNVPVCAEVIYNSPHNNITTLFGCEFDNVKTILTTTNEPYQQLYSVLDDDIQRFSGIYTTGVSALYGKTRSLKIRGKDYCPPYMVWIPCKAGIPKTVNFQLVKKTNSASHCADVVFGNQNLSLDALSGKDSASYSYINTTGSTTAWTNTYFAPPATFSNALLTASTTASIFNIKFYGDGITIKGSKNASYGNFGIVVDEGVEESVDCYNATLIHKQELKVISGLDEGWHTITIRPLGTKNGLSSGYTICIDSYVVTSFGGTKEYPWYAEQEVLWDDADDAGAIHNVTITYTHYKTELVPLYFYGRCDNSSQDWYVIDNFRY